ncbi:DUF5615 family PIN-like protein [Nostoc sp.]|uniref:DUF5615 family PIN-like protein n=1 Tax=Nostoc sp. TaxID=1180 RepID=UPI002FF8EADC
MLKVTAKHFSNNLLRRYGINVTTTNDVELRTQSDEVQLAFIQETQRVLFTQDADFLIIASSRLDHPGITYSKKGTSSRNNVNFYAVTKQRLH